MQREYFRNEPSQAQIEWEMSGRPAPHVPRDEAEAAQWRAEMNSQQQPAQPMKSTVEQNGMHFEARGDGFYASIWVEHTQYYGGHGSEVVLGVSSTPRAAFSDAVDMLWERPGFDSLTVNDAAMRAAEELLPDEVTDPDLQAAYDAEEECELMWHCELTFTLPAAEE